MISLKNVFFKYNKKRMIIEDLNFKIEQGDIIGILGHNGAGKTTLFKLILGILKSCSGEVVCDLEKDKISYVPEEGGIYLNLSPIKNIFFRADINHINVTYEKINSYMKKLKLSNRSGDVSVREWSNGMKKRLAIVCALITSPQLLLLDEPTNGLDPESRKIVCSILQEENRKGTTILVNTHDLQLVQEICTKILIIQNGKNIYLDIVGKQNLESLYFEKVKCFE